MSKFKMVKLSDKDEVIKHHQYYIVVRGGIASLRQECRQRGLPTVSEHEYPTHRYSSALVRADEPGYLDSKLTEWVGQKQNTDTDLTTDGTLLFYRKA